METQRYFEGSPEDEVPEFSAEIYEQEVTQKSEQELSELEIDLKEQIDLDIDNEHKKKHAIEEQIIVETLTPEVKNAEALHKMHEEQLAIVKKIRKGLHKKKGSILGSFF